MIRKVFTVYKTTSSLFFADLLKYKPDAFEEITYTPVTPNISIIDIKWRNAIVLMNKHKVYETAESQWIYLKDKNVVLINGQEEFANVSINKLEEKTTIHLEVVKVFDYYKEKFADIDFIYSLKVKHEFGKTTNITINEAKNHLYRFSKEYSIIDFGLNLCNLPLILEDNNTLTFYDTTTDEEILNNIESILSEILNPMNKVMI